ncbi:glycosyltransferase [Mycobacterium sp. TNTM28]|uniref:Glycosyltransferase n=2 Tax=[Mycobacterium] fortunisiensis TaxID=2600579 RepID=A0ABS6KMT1_9MYCO|nr:glycosyltransferase family 2 protein [[Mycobacterium] fortunisiensis]MBU9764890.1 glycosyltransferase [[Mycobacterium] fortunisiensis]
MPATGAPDGGPHARWIGWLDVDHADSSRGQVTIEPTHAESYRRARILLRHGLDPLDFVEADIVGGTVTVPVPQLPQAGDRPTDVAKTPISVVLCTRERPHDLAGALGSITALDYPDFEIVVVDNAPRTDATERVVEAIADPRVRRVVEPVPGLSNARNAGLRAARHDVVAFTDDDVTVDPHWLRALARAFTQHPDAACVCGLVPSGELRTAAQAYFDQRVSWADSLQPRRYCLTEPPSDTPLFPFQIGRYGTGANFAVKRAPVIELGGFDEALGAGTAARGGEDIDMFYRLIVAGHTLVNDPAAIVWHRHRSDAAALLAQAKGYGLGLGAWLTKVALDREHRRRAFLVARRRFRDTARSGAAYGAIAAPARGYDDAVPPGVGRTEVLSVLGGPWALWRGRRQGRLAQPLHAPPGRAG